ncbi:MAG TPA: ABC transporter substrate-binding protein [Actinomycetota bacterium]|nr:ABC transporter substrate-binding protein [Actinomycetota bacterium]
MRKARTTILVGAVTVLAMVGVACSNVSSSTSGPGGSGSASVPDNSGTTITLAISPWQGSAANVAVAKALLEDKLGYTVATTNIDEYAQFPAIAKDTIDATLEIWPSGHAADYKKYIAGNNGIVDGGKLGVIGQIGWYIPTYMLTAHPELATWQGLKTDAGLFKTAESGSAGQILDGDPSYVTFDQAIADNLGLNLKVVYAGSEAAELTALKTAYAKQAPILMYFWKPHWAQKKYDLTNVQLPAVTAACTSAAANNPSAYACAYPEDDLYKAFSDKLQAKAPAAFAFLSAMSYTNDDQDGIALDINNGMTPAAAAQKWIDANPSVWQPWVDAGLAAQSGSAAPSS